MFLRHLELLQLNHLHMNTQKKYKAEMHKASQLAASFPSHPGSRAPFYSFGFGGHTETAHLAAHMIKKLRSPDREAGHFGPEPGSGFGVASQQREV